ncbi:MAG: NAD(P)/FAD-dependent oxidoreductase [archaeon]
MDQKYDVIIIGAGPAGTITARRCAEHGLKVLVLEKRPEIGSPKRCAEGIGLSENLFKLGYTGKERFVNQTINASMIFAPNGHSIEIAAHPHGFIIERKVFDKFLAYDAAKSGAKIYTKADVIDLIRTGGMISGVKVIYNGEQKEISGRIIVSAEGVESKIARLAGLKTKNTLRTIEPGYQYEMANIDLKDPHKVCIYLGSSIAPRGYIWIFPKGSHIANVGIGACVKDEKTAKYYLDRWIETQPGIKKGSIIEENAGAIPIGGFLKSMTTDNFLAVGDAAHQVNPLHGGGLEESAYSAEIAAEVINEAIFTGDTSQKTLNKYNGLWYKKRGNTLSNVEKIVNILEKLTDSDMNMLADTITPQDICDLLNGKIHKAIKIFLKYPKLATLIRHIK